MRTILVTGATGYLGSHLIKRIIDDDDTRVVAILGRPEDTANQLPRNDRIAIYPCSDLFTTNFGHVDALIHTAFSRGDNLLGLTASIEMTEKVIELVNEQDVDSMINISSQGVYKGLLPGEKVTEDGEVGPNTVYGLAKWAVENMLRIGCKKHYTNIRMASLSANARFLDFFVDSVIGHKEIKITAPRQYASIMDVSDAVSGILAICNLPIKEREHIYNVGPGVQYSILDYAQSAKEVGASLGFSPTSIVVEDFGKEFAICMDSQKLQSQTGWKPQVTKASMIHKIFKQKSIENE